MSWLKQFLNKEKKIGFSLVRHNFYNPNMQIFIYSYKRKSTLYLKLLRMLRFFLNLVFYVSQ